MNRGKNTHRKKTHGNKIPRECCIIRVQVPINYSRYKNPSQHIIIYIYTKKNNKTNVEI